MESLAKGTILKIDQTGTFNPIADLLEISPPSMSVDMEEITNHNQTGYFRQHRPTLIDPGELSGTILWDPADSTHDDTSGLLSFLTGRSVKDMKIDFPTDPVQTWAFKGVVTGFDPETPIDEHLKGGFTIKLTDAITITNAPIITNVDDTGADGPAYITTETIELTVTFDRAVTVTGTPQMTLQLNSGNVTLSFASGSGTTALVFSYVVQGGDSAAAGQFVIPAQTIALNGGTMKDSGGNDVRRSFKSTDVSNVSDRTVN